MGFELLIPPPGRRPASQGHVCAVAKRVTDLTADRMSGTSDTAKKKKDGHGPSTSTSASHVALLCLRFHLLTSSSFLFFLLFLFDNVSLRPISSFCFPPFP